MVISKDISTSETPLSSSDFTHEVPSGIFEISDSVEVPEPPLTLGIDPVETVETIAEAMTIQDEWTDVEHNYSDEGLLSMDSQAIEIRRLINTQLCVIITGTSGAGKSTIADQVASIFGAKLISTDFMRHELRQLVSKKEAKFLHCSTYNAWEVFSEADKKKNSREGLALKGFKKQARLICGKNCKNLRSMLERAFDGEHIIVLEGVHLHPKLIKELSKNLSIPVVPFVISTSSEDAHYQRLSFRAENMGLHPVNNKYCKNFKNIRTIAEYMSSTAKMNHIPVLSNRSLELSVASITEALLTVCMRFTLSARKRFTFSKNSKNKPMKLFGKSTSLILDCFVDRNKESNVDYEDPGAGHNPVVNKPTFHNPPATRSPLATVEIDLDDLNVDIPLIANEPENRNGVMVVSKISCE